MKKVELESEAKPVRTLAEIQQEYQGLCTKAGHLQYQIHALSKDLDLINETLRSINIEASKLPKAEEPAKVEGA